METVTHIRGRGRANGHSHSRNRHWVAGENGQRSGSSTPYHSDGERWERGGSRGGHRGRGAPRARGKFSNVSIRIKPAPPRDEPDSEVAILDDEEMDGTEEVHADDEGFEEPEEPTLDSAEEREKFFQTLVKAREAERKKAIAEGKMDDPSIPKRLEDAITVVGTCLDMCPRFERYRRERENNLFQWETIPGTKRVDHKRAVKMYERAAGDKTLPSDLRPPPVLKKTLDYLFHDLLLRGGFSATYDFIRDRSRSVRNDFTMQHSYGPEAIECHDRCARFHILALHLERDNRKFSIAMEEQQLMNTLQSLKEFYEDQRGRYESPTELEMRVYHRLIHIRDQKERHEDIPDHISSHPVFKLTTEFRLHVQRKSAPISKNSPLKVDAEGMHIFGELANDLREQGNVVMIYLVACILERLFGKDAIEDIDTIRGDMSIPDIIDGISSPLSIALPTQEEPEPESYEGYEGEEEMQDDEVEGGVPDEPTSQVVTGSGVAPQAPPPLPEESAFSNIKTTPNVFNTPSPFGHLSFPSSATPILGVPATSVFGNPTPPSQTPTVTNVFGTGILPFPASSPLLSVPAANVSSSVAPPKPSSDSPSDPSTSFPIAPSAIGTFRAVPPHTKPSLGEPSIFDIPVSSPNGFPTLGTATSTLNPKATTFTPIFPSSQTSTPTPFDATPPIPFTRSSNPSPSPFPPNSQAPPTPAPPLSFPNKSSITRTSSHPPILPQIDTNTTLERPIDSPIVPPPAPKPHLISLPATPTIDQPHKTILNSFKGHIGTLPSRSNSDILSPIFMHSPTTSGLHEFPFVSKSPSKGRAEQSGLLFNINGKDTSPTKPQFDEEEAESKSAIFARKSTIVKSCLRRWHQRIIDRLAWIEACRQSDAYKEKIKHRQASSLQLDKKRRISTGPGATIILPVKKRLRRRVSSEYRPPRTDEELAQRFKENHEEHQRRWAQGSFLNVIKNHVKLKNRGVHPSWRIWLSMNPDSDATAIWLERKFDVPISGDWISEAVFSIPITRTADPESPGLIIFERTPMDDIIDDLERKYRILDDCTRLRDIVQAFPAKRHFSPSLLIISWTEGGEAESASDFRDMVNKLVETHVIEGFQTLAITAAIMDLDEKLAGALNTLVLDLQGKLVKVLTIRGTFQPFTWLLMPNVNLLAPRHIQSIPRHIHFFHIGMDRNMLLRQPSQLVSASTSLINTVCHSVAVLLSEQLSQGVLPTFDSGSMTDDGSAYDSIIIWLSAIGGNANTIAQTLKAHRDIGRSFPSQEFFAQLWDFAQLQTEIRLRVESTKQFYLPVSEITAAVGAQNAEYELHRVHLGRTLHLNMHLSPRRRSLTADTEAELTSSAKRRRLLSPVESLEDEANPFLTGNLTPSPSLSNISLPQSEASTTPGVQVTVAMLRALTRDVRKRYSVPSS
ncbi:hypothetical protein H0H92_000270 [Tricholoma furcatifolium]|nr:hypothetical protein H0H92_000270 [Tricholoma furcatifolium]